MTYSKAYNDPPFLTAIMVGGSPGDDLILTNPTASDFDAEVKDSAGARVVRTVNLHTIGF